ncbi:MAG: sigma 54-interacting transcriptional regulator [Alphaproteobacteria bacterium]|nr:sigma 54-interacting transcriptional regulator [Alphaproteobacteria bacterium]
MVGELIPQIREVEAALRRGELAEAKRLLSLVRREAARLKHEGGALEGSVSRYREILARTLEVTHARDLEPLADQVLDGVLSVVGARRGFLGLVEGEGWRFLAARNLTQSDLEDPEQHVSTGIIGEALELGQPVLVDDAGAEFSGRASVQSLGLRSVVCLPLLEGERRVGFVYLDDPETQGLFDSAALAAAQAWLPIIASSLARASEAEPAELVGVVSRAKAMRAQLRELARVARFDAPVLLTGETGTGKSLIAQALHRASPRAGGPFVHVNCGAIPEALLESELFGHRKGAFTGASADRAGRFEAAKGGTIFLDELDSMPPSCQVKLLVALQERKLTRLGDTTPVDLDVRVLAAMGSDPFDAIDAGRLREDLYYRLAVFVAPLPPLRERREDIPLLASHFLEQTRSRYGLPPLRLEAAALEQLLAHAWPGNVRELANVLDRAALLAEEGVIREVQLRGRRAAAGGVSGALERGAVALVDAMESRPALQSWDQADAFRAAVLLEAVRRYGLVEGFGALGLAKQVESRNHHRTLRREGERLKALCEALGEEMSGELEGVLG